MDGTRRETESSTTDVDSWVNGEEQCSGELCRHINTKERSSEHECRMRELTALYNIQQTTLMGQRSLFLLCQFCPHISALKMPCDQDSLLPISTLFEWESQFKGHRQAANVLPARILW